MSAGAAKLTFAIRAVNEAKAAMDEARRDLQGLSDAAEQANSRFSVVGAALSSLGSSMQTVGKAAMVGLAGGVGALAGGLGLALRASADFERQLNVVASVAGAAGAELEGLRRTALALGESTAFSAAEVTQAMEVLAANGISTRDIIDGAAKAALDLAAAGSTSLVQAADTVSTAMAVWNLTTADLTDTVNRLAGAANVSRFGVEDMALAIAQGGGAAAAAGVEFADFAGAIAAIAPLFASGSDAGTSFKTFLQRLVPTSTAAAEAMAELGLITADGANRFFDAEGKLRPMPEIVDELNRALSRLTEQDRTRLLGQAFGTDAMRTAIGLSRLTKGEFEQLMRTMGEASAAEIGEQRMRGLAGAMEQFRGALETARIEIGDRINPVMTRFFEALAALVPKLKEGVLAAMDRFAADVLPRLQAALDAVRGAWERFRAPIMQFLQSSEAANVGLGLLAAVLLSVAVAAGSAAAGMLAAVAPVAALGLAIGGLLILADRLGVDWARTWDGIREAVGRAADWLLPRIQAFAEQAGALLRRFGAYWETELRPAVERTISALTAAFQAIEPVIRPVVEASIGVLRTFAATAAQVIGNVIQIIGRLVDIVVQLIQGDWASAWNSAKEVVRLALDTVQVIIRGTAQMIHQTVAGFFEAGKALLKGLADGITAAWAEHAWPFLSDLPGKLLGAFGGAASWLYDIGRAIIRGLWDGLKAMWGEVEGWLGGIGDRIKKLKGPPEKDRVLLYDIGRMIMEGLKHGLADAFDEDVAAKLRAIGSSLVRHYQDAVADLQDRAVPDWRNLGNALTEALAAGYFDGFKKNKPLLEQVARELTQAVGAAAEDAGVTLQQVLNTTGKTLNQTLAEIRQLMTDNLAAGRQLTVHEVRQLLYAMEDLLESPAIPAAARALGERTIAELLASLEQGRGAANAVIAQLAEDIAKAVSSASGAAPAVDPSTPGYGVVGWRPDQGGIAPRGAHGIQMVWDPQLEGWVMPWEVGAYGNRQDWMAAQLAAQTGASLAGAIPVVRTEVAVQVDGREVARAAAEAAGRQSFAWGF